MTEKKQSGPQKKKLQVENSHSYKFEDWDPKTRFLKVDFSKINDTCIFHIL